MREWLEGYGRRAARFEREAHQILAGHEAAPSRTVVLRETYERLDSLDITQDDLMRQALRCIESQLYRAAYVMGWAAFIDFLQDRMAIDGMSRIKAVRPKWNYGSIEELRESIPDRQIVEASRELGLCTKTEMKGLIGLLQRRNECAHPSGFYPGLNEALGYVSELIKRIEEIERRLQCST